MSANAEVVELARWMRVSYAERVRAGGDAKTERAQRDAAFFEMCSQRGVDWKEAVRLHRRVF